MVLTTILKLVQRCRADYVLFLLFLGGPDSVSLMQVWKR